MTKFHLPLAVSIKMSIICLKRDTLLVIFKPVTGFYKLQECTHDLSLVIGNLDQFLIRFRDKFRVFSINVLEII